MTEENKRILAAAVLDALSKDDEFKDDKIEGVVVTHSEVYVVIDGGETAVRYLHNYGDVDLSAAAIAPMHLHLDVPHDAP